jgi:hypothetical protein
VVACLGRLRAKWPVFNSQWPDLLRAGHHLLAVCFAVAFLFAMAGAARASLEPIAGMGSHKTDFVWWGNAGSDSVNESYRVARVDVDTELSGTFTPKNVSVAGFAGRIDRDWRLRLLSEHWLQLWSNGIDARKIASVFVPWVNRGLAVSRQIRVFGWFAHFGVVGEREDSDETDCVGLKVSCRRSASITHFYGENDRPGNIEINQLHNRKNIGPELADSHKGDNDESYKQRNSLKSPDDDADDTNFSRTLYRRALLLIGSILCSFGLDLWGGMRLDYERPVFSPSIIAAGIRIPTLGWFLFGATLFRSTWSWWL